MPIKQLKKIHIHPDEPVAQSFNRVQTELMGKLNQVLRNPLLNGKLITGISLTAHTPQNVSHGLGRNYIGWLLSRPQADGYVYETASPDPTTTIQLNCDINITFDLYAF